MPCSIGWVMTRIDPSKAPWHPITVWGVQNIVIALSLFVSHYFTHLLVLCERLTEMLVIRYKAFETIPVDRRGECRHSFGRPIRLES